MLGDQTATAMEASSAVAGIKALRTRLAKRRAVAARTQGDLAHTQLETAKAEVSQLLSMSQPNAWPPLQRVSAHLI